MNDMNDLISRHWLMECVEEGWIKFDTEKDKNKFIHLVRDTAPSAQPERKRGKWIKARGSWCTPGGDPVWECSECGKGVHVYGIEYSSYSMDVSDGQWVSCPNCGADMRIRGEQDD